MADRYVWSGATGTGDATSWANAATTLVGAFTGIGNYDNIFVAHDHDETTAATVTITNGGIPGRQIICCNRLGSVPPVPADITTGAVLRTTGNFDFSVDNGFTFYGIRFKPGDNGGSTTGGRILARFAQRFLRFVDCVIDLSGNTSSASVLKGSDGGAVTLIDCQIRFGATTQRVNMGGIGMSLLWSSTKGLPVLEAGSIVPANLINPPFEGTVELEGLDLTPMGTNPIFPLGPHGNIRLTACKQAAGGIITNGANGRYVEIIDSDEGATGFRHERYTPKGQLFTDTATYLTDGAVMRGVPVSWRLSTEFWTAAPEFLSTFEGALYNSDAGAPKTLTWEFLSNASITNAELFVEVEYPGSATSPLQHIATNFDKLGLFDRLGVAHPSSTAAWSNPGALTTKQKMSVSFTPQRAGPIKWRIFYGRPRNEGFLVYVDPQPTLS